MRNFLLLSLGLFISASPVRAGAVDGGGGGAYVCRNADGSIRSARMADLWESENTPYLWPHKRGKLSIAYSNTVSAEAQFHKAIEKIARLDPYIAARVRAERDKLFREKNSLPDSISIALPDDLKLGYFPTGCPAEGIMFYNGFSEQLDVREDLFAALATQTDIAAAWAHETLYKMAREWMYETDSKGTRRLVACLLSDEEGCFRAWYRPFPQDTITFRCENERFSVKIAPDGFSTNDPLDLVQDKWRLMQYRGDLEKFDSLGISYKPFFAFFVKDRALEYKGSGLSGDPFAFYGPRAGGTPLGSIGPSIKLGKIWQGTDGLIQKISIKEFSYGPYNRGPEKVIPVNQELPCRRIR